MIEIIIIILLLMLHLLGIFMFYRYESDDIFLAAIIGGMFPYVSIPAIIGLKSYKIKKDFKRYCPKIRILPRNDGDYG